MTGHKLLSAAGLLLAVVMGVLLKLGTTDGGLFVVWLVLLFAGIGLFGLGRKLDSDARRQVLDEERRTRLAGRSQPGPPQV